MQVRIVAGTFRATPHPNNGEVIFHSKFALQSYIDAAQCTAEIIDDDGTDVPEKTVEHIESDHQAEFRAARAASK
jgi:hypothetical protein